MIKFFDLIRPKGLSFLRTRGVEKFVVPPLGGVTPPKGGTTNFPAHK